MNLPHPPGSHGQEPPNGGQTGGGAHQPWSQSPGGPTLPPPAGPPPWGPQQQWANGPTPPPNGGSKAKWILGGLSVVLAIALAAVVTVLIIRPDGESRAADDDSGASSSEFASANDTGPVSIITDDPTCDAWNTVAGQYSQAVDAVDWEGRNSEIPATSWTSSQRSMYEAVGEAMSLATEQASTLARQTPHRVMRELYEQFVAHTRAFVERIPSYVTKDDDLVAASNGAGGSISNLCGGIAYRSAQATAPLVPRVARPKEVVKPVASLSPERFMAQPNAICRDWLSSVEKFSAESADWREVNKSTPAKEWTPEQRAIHEAVAPIMSASADDLERLGRRSGDPVLEDIATMAAQYRRAFVITLPAYTSADSYLELSATNMVRLINWACKAVL